MYSKSIVKIKLNEEKHKGIPPNSGTSQGCPLSAWLFNIVLELLPISAWMRTGEANLKGIQIDL